MPIIYSILKCTRKKQKEKMFLLRFTLKFYRAKKRGDWCRGSVTDRKSLEWPGKNRIQSSHKAGIFILYHKYLLIKMSTKYLKLGGNDRIERFYLPQSRKGTVYRPPGGGGWETKQAIKWKSRDEALGVRGDRLDGRLCFEKVILNSHWGGSTDLWIIFWTQKI